MTTPFRLKLLSASVGAAIVQLAAAPAQADSAVGVDTMLGNALNPTTINQLRKRDPEGLDAQIYRRTPTGQLYDWPLVPPNTRESSSGWIYSGSIEVGGTGVFGTEDSAWFEKYKDLDDGLYLNNFEFEAYQPDSALYVEGLGGALGYDDQFFGFKFGRYNDWRGKLFYQETPHTFTTKYRSLWTTTEDDYLPLRSLTPGGTVNNTTTIANVEEAIEATDFSTLGIVRRKGGLTVEKYLTDTWTLLGSYSLENREGSRPFGAVFGGGGGGGNVEIPEPIDYDTHDIWAALRYDDGVNNVNLGVTASLFRNNHDTLTFENPLYINAQNGFNPTTFKTGTYDLYPDNDYWNVKGEYARSMPDFYNGRLTALASFSWMTQDDDLIPWTMYDLAGGRIDGIPTGNQWNTLDALTRDSADAEINTMLFDVGMSLRPTDKLGLQGKIRYYEMDNETEFFACNPLTGQWGRLINDGSGDNLESAYTAAGCDLAAAQAYGMANGIVAGSGRTVLRNVPFDYGQWNFVLGGDYRLTPSSTLTGTLEREEIDRDGTRERDTWESSFKLGYVNRGFQFGTLRLSAEYAERRGDDYNTNAYYDFTAESLGPEPTTGQVRDWIHDVNGLQKFDLADRNRWVLNGRLNLIAADPLDIGLTANYKDDEYPSSEFGRTDHFSVGSGSIDVNYQPSDKLGLYGFYTYQRSHIEQTNVQASGGGQGCTIGRNVYGVLVTENNWHQVCANVSPTNPLWPQGNVWSVEGQESNNVFGLGGTYDFGVARVSLDYSFIDGVYQNDQSYNPVFRGDSAETVALIGGGFPNYEYTQHILDLSAFFPISKNLGIRALYRYEEGTIDDWHYDGVYENPTPTNNTVYLDSGLEDYHNSVVGLFLHMSF